MNIYASSKKSRSYRKVFTLENEAPPTIKQMHHARLRDPGTRESLLWFQGHGNCHNTFSSESNGKTFTSVDEIL